MTFQQVLWIALCASLAFGGVWYQYIHTRKKTEKRILLGSLRFVGIFGIFILLVPLKLEKTTTSREKHRLILLLDNSSSAGREPSRTQMLAASRLFTQDPEIEARFDLNTYTFGASLKSTDSLDFSENATDISAVLEAVSRVTLGDNSSILLVTDGIENQGRSLAVSPQDAIPVFPVLVGDTTQYRDIRIDRINLNRFAFLGNQYPIEVLLSYRGAVPGKVRLQILDNDSIIHRQNLEFPAGRSAKRLEILARAREVGLHSIKAVAAPLKEETNPGNNTRTAGIEVIDETTKISLVSSHAHPDIGTLGRSIQANEQRQFRILNPNDVGTYTENTDLWILYQPDRDFRAVYEILETRKTPVMTIAGSLTDWDFLNEIQDSYSLEEQGPIEELLPERNASFGYFDISDWNINTYPPLEGLLGEYLIFQPHQWLLEQRVRGVLLNQPLMALIKGSDRREAVIFGSGLWKWRMHAYAMEGDFRNFDRILGKVLLFLSAGVENDRLSLDYPRVYSGQSPAVIRARYFDEALRFDPQARLTLQLFDSTSTELASYPIALRKDYFEADISNLTPGDYSFKVDVAGTELSRSGQFRLQAFDLEGQKLRSNYEGLSRLAENSGGVLYFPSEINNLRDSLLNADQFRPLQRSHRNVVSLIDYWWLLALIAASLGTEWFIRKYNGLI